VSDVDGNSGDVLLLNLMCMSVSYSAFHTSSVHEPFLAPPTGTITASCHILFHSTSTPLHHIPLRSPSPFLFHSTFMFILLSPLSILISALLYWLDKIPFYILCLSSVTPWSLLSYLVILNVLPTCVFTYLHLSWHMYSIYCYLLLWFSTTLSLSSINTACRLPCTLVWISTWINSCLIVPLFSSST